MIVIGLILILFLLGIIYFSFRILKTLGYPKTGKYVAIFLTLSIIVLTIHAFVEDDLFSKSDAQDLLTEQDIQLKDNFNLEKNESTFSPGDYYHTFTLNISTQDKQRIINEIKQSSNFLKGDQSESYVNDDNNYYNGPKRIKNYETEEQFVRELFKPNGKGYAPTWRKIEIDKKTNKLIFEDIDL
jgi:hypothetical protein